MQLHRHEPLLQRPRCWVVDRDRGQDKLELPCEWRQAELGGGSTHHVLKCTSRWLQPENVPECWYHGAGCATEACVCLCTACDSLHQKFLPTVLPNNECRRGRCCFGARGPNAHAKQAGKETLDSCRSTEVWKQTGQGRVQNNLDLEFELALGSATQGKRWKQKSHVRLARLETHAITETIRANMFTSRPSQSYNSTS
jgi:hypothetical protein